jgi:ribosomal protein L37AE/L43A
MISIRPNPQNCKRCHNAVIRIARDMRLWWVECDKCKYTWKL